MEETFDHEIAIIALAGRFPGARNIDEFWLNLRNGVETIAHFSEEELLASGIDAAMIHNPKYVRAKGMLDDIDLFDATFFGYSPREAELMDPQQRLFLECAWEALENAGYTSETYEGRIGVYASTSISSYLLCNLFPNRELLQTAGGLPQLIMGNNKDSLATCVSYKLNLKGPSINVNTACSSSLVAAHLACQSLQSGESDMALVGGTSINVPQKEGYLYQEGGIASPDGHCRAFDERAQGCVGGDGVGIVVLKRLTDALADRDCIHAVIKGSAINNDGAAKVGFTAPSEDGQAAVIAEAFAMANIAPETVTYIETHGTGTPLGDPIEVAALTQVFKADTEKRGFCAIGSVKTNIGHLDAASGVVGLIKTVLALQHRQIPPSLHFEHPNPKLKISDGPFYVNTRLKDWVAGDAPRRAGVSSFGLGGTNAHVLLEEAPLSAGDITLEKRAQVLVLSAQTRSALEQATDNLVAHLKQHPDLNLADVAYTLQAGRHVFDQRRILTCVNLNDAVTALERRDSQRVLTTLQESRDRPVAFLFPNENRSLLNVGKELYQAEAVFREQIDLCSEFLKPLLGIDLRKVLYPDEEQYQEANQQLQQAILAASALFVIEYALARLWISWGIVPQAMMGDGPGEYVAACLAEVFELPDALALVAGHEYAGQIHLQEPHIPYVSSRTGTWISLQEATNPAYWGKQLGQSARFAEGMRALVQDAERLLLEVGPVAMQCLRVTQQNDSAQPLTVFPSLRSPEDQKTESEGLTETLGRLWLAGATINWSGVHAGEQRQRISLPTYPFERKRYWIEPPREVKASEEEIFPNKPDTSGQQGSSRTSYVRPDLQTTYVAPGNELEQTIAIIWQELLGIDQLGVYDNFFEVGGHSLMGAQLITRLRETFMIDVPFQRLFEKPSITGLAEVVEELLSAKIDALSDAEVERLLSHEPHYN